MFKNYKELKKINNSKLSDEEWYDTDSNGRGIIDVGAENYDDVFSYYDLEGENVLDDEFDAFLEAKADAIPLKKELAIHFHVKGANEAKRIEIERAVKNHFKREIRALNRKVHKNTMICIYMLIMGLIAFGIYVGLELLNNYVINGTLHDVFFIITYVFDISAWVFFWEVVDNFFIRRRSIRFEILKKFRFVKADIDVYEYKTKKKHQQKFGKNAKTLNKLLKNADKNQKIVQNKLSKIKNQGEINVNNS